MADTSKAAELIVRCFQARTEAHLAHLGVSGPGAYAKHKALNEFYDGIVDAADAYAEAAQGRSGEILKYPTLRPRVGDSAQPISIPSDLRTWVDANRGSCGPESELQNLIDEIVALCNSTIYKLRFLS